MNPSGQPFPSQFGSAPPPPGGGGGGGAREALNIPGILFMVFGGLSVLLALYGMVGNNADNPALSKLMTDPNIPPQLKDFVRVLAGSGAKVLNLLAAAMSGLLIFGGVQMRNLKSYGVAIAACVIGMLPCTSCCCVTIPIAIWTLTILMRPEIKSSFT